MAERGKWVRGLGLNQRPLGNKPSVLPLNYPGIDRALYHAARRDFYAFFTPSPRLSSLFLRAADQTPRIVFAGVFAMDFVWIAALAALWVAAIELALGLARLGRPKGERS